MQSASPDSNGQGSHVFFFKFLLFEEYEKLALTSDDFNANLERHYTPLWNFLQHD